MISKIPIPGLFITGTDTGVGKTVIAGAIASWFVRQNVRVGVCKIAATGCEMRDGHLISEDAEYLSVASGARFSSQTICPIRYAQPLAPAVAARLANQSLDWSLLRASINTLVKQSDVLVVEGVGGVMVPMDERHTVLDVARWLALPAVVVSRPGLGTINHSLLTINALRSAGVSVSGVVVNRFKASATDPSVQSNSQAIAQFGNVRILCQVPGSATTSLQILSKGIAAIDAVDWQELAAANNA